VVRPVNAPLKATGGLVILHGNLALTGASSRLQVMTT
jgi:dihydroxyacid dehydratase/phosphogluconate dehydratase